MFKFEGLKRNKNEENLSNNTNEKSVDISEQIKKAKHSNNINKILKYAIIAGAIGDAGGASFLVKDRIEENKKELSQEKEIAEKYEIKENQFVADTIDYLSDDFVSKVALVNKSQHFEDLIKEQDYILTLEKDLKGEDLIRLKEQLIKYDYDISAEKQKLTDEEKQFAKDKIIDILNMVENSKLEVVGYLRSEEYLEKLSKEMDISKESAKEHQKARINNVKNISYELVTNSKIFGDTDGFGYAYYLNGTNKIVLPYNINLGDPEENKFFSEAITHEILHESTMASKGLSGTVEEYMRDSFKNKENESVEDSIYYSKPCELIVRKQILDLNMEKSGIKKYGDKFNEEHYQKLLKLKEEGKLTPNETQLIEHIKPEDFVNMMNGLAENKDEAKGDYYNPEWKYGNEDNQA